MKRFRFNKIKWDKIISAVVVVALLVGCVAGLTALVNTKTTDVSDFNFKKGALDSAGLYVDSDTSIYTKDLIECQGLVIEPDFEATGSYQVFYYSTNKTFIGSTDKFDAHTYGVYEKGGDFSFAKYCRIVISPDTPVDEDGYPVEDWKIHFWEVASYADDYKITVNKKQSSNIGEGFSYDVSSLESCGFTISNEGLIVLGEDYCGAIINLNNLDDEYANVRFTNNTLDTKVGYAFLTELPTADGETPAYTQGSTYILASEASVDVVIPSDAVYLFVYMRSGDINYLPDSIEFFK